MHKLIYFVNICFGLGLLASYIAPWINPESFEYISLFGLFFPVFVLANILFVLYWIFKKTRNSIFSIICLLLGWSSIGGFIQFGNSESSDKEAIKVLSYNVRGLHIRKDDNTTINEMTAFFHNKQRDIDVFCFQEKGRTDETLLHKIFPDHHYIGSIYGIALFTHHEILKKGVLKIGGNTGEAVWADIKFPTGTARVYSFHLSSNLISRKTDALLEDADLNEETWTGLKGILRSYTGHSVKRKQQLDILMDHVRKSPHPVIMAGDMNDVPQSYVYRLFTKNRQDSFRVKGKGLGVSFGDTYPFLRIDYILPDHNFKILKHEVKNVPFSDHFPVRSHLIFEK